MNHNEAIINAMLQSALIEVTIEYIYCIMLIIDIFYEFFITMNRLSFQEIQNLMEEHTQ